jgi:hypothetical protein
VEVGALEFHPAGLDLGQVQDVVDDVQQVPAELSILSSRSACSGVAPARRIRCVRPMMAFIGVRISWLMFARKALLARLAASASSLARSSACSTSLRRVMSVMKAISFGGESACARVEKTDISTGSSCPLRVRCCGLELHGPHCGSHRPGARKDSMREVGVDVGHRLGSATRPPCSPVRWKRNGWHR